MGKELTFRDDPWLKQTLSSRMPATGPMLIQEQYRGQLCPYGNVSALGADTDMLSLTASDGKLLAIVHVRRVMGPNFQITGVDSVSGQNQSLQDAWLSLQGQQKEEFSPEKARIAFLMAKLFVD